MKKLMKPVALMFVIAVSTGAYAQQDKAARQLKVQLKEKPATQVQAKRQTKAISAPKRDADTKRIVRRHKGLTHAKEK